MLQQAKPAFHFICSNVVALVLATAVVLNTVRAQPSAVYAPCAAHVQGAACSQSFCHSHFSTIPEGPGILAWQAPVKAPNRNLTSSFLSLQPAALRELSL